MNAVQSKSPFELPCWTVKELHLQNMDKSFKKVSQLPQRHPTDCGRESEGYFNCYLNHRKRNSRLARPRRKVIISTQHIIALDLFYNNAIGTGGCTALCTDRPDHNYYSTTQ